MNPVNVVHISRKILTDEKSGENKKQNKKHRVRSLQGHIEDVQNFTV